MTTREKLREIIDERKTEISQSEIKHRNITERIEKSIDMEEISVTSGVRRAGKTFIMYELIKKHGGTYINFEDERLIDFKLSDFEKLYSIALEEKSEFLFLDEVQVIPGWEKFAARAQKRIKLFVTGSNSTFLSSEFSSVLTGRTMTFRVYPLSFSEFLFFRESSAKTKDELRAEAEHYLDLGGFPRIVLTENKNLIHEYFNRIIYRDVIPRFDVKKPDSMYRLAVFLLTHIGMRFSYRKLREYCNLKHESTVKLYTSYLEKAFLLNVLNKFDPSLKKQEVNPKKVYSVDPAFSEIAGAFSVDKSRIFENIVYDQLKRKLPEAGIFYEEKKSEVDFIMTKGSKPVIGINACYELNKEKTFEREISGLNELNKNMKKILVSLYLPKFDIPKNIEFVDGIDFLLGKYAL
jgi:predicted AAA+ superfamily ATPase